MTQHLYDHMTQLHEIWTTNQDAMEPQHNMNATDKDNQCNSDSNATPNTNLNLTCHH